MNNRARMFKTIVKSWRLYKVRPNSTHYLCKHTIVHLNAIDHLIVFLLKIHFNVLFYFFCAYIFYMFLRTLTVTFTAVGRVWIKWGKGGEFREILRRKKDFYLLSNVTLAVSKVRHLPHLSPLRYGHDFRNFSQIDKKVSH